MRGPYLLVILTACGRFGFSSADQTGVDGESPDGVVVDGDGVDGAVDAVVIAPNVAFVTSTTIPNGNLGGPDMADQICRDRAAAGGLSGDFIAYISRDGMQAVDRVADARGWVDTIGRPLVDLAADWSTGNQWHALQYTELGTLTRSTSLVGVPGFSCMDWTSAAQANVPATLSVEPVLSLWAGACAGAGYSLVCMEHARQAVVTGPVVTGRIAFVTRGTFLPGGGIAAADSLCAQEASAAGLTGTFLANLGTSAGPGADRFSATGPAWHAVGLPLVTATAAEYLTAHPDPFHYDGFIDRDATGAVRYARTWSGGATHCQDWTSALGTETGGVGSPFSLLQRHTRGWTASSCSVAEPLLCLEQ